MKRSEVNQIVRNAVDFFRRHQFLLPPFAYYELSDWRNRLAASREIIDLGLGWDVTTFGTGDFAREGLLLFTLRNGRFQSREYPKVYAEKIMMVGENQITPQHFHWHKQEDIINRGGGNLLIELWKAGADDKLTDEPLTLSIDGELRTFRSGETLRLRPGESVSFTPYSTHRFRGEPKCGPVLVGEVSMVNDDHADNCFIEKKDRFDSMEEDEAPLYLLCSDYDKFLKADGK
ncbi:MAG: D-lyxose/D-mannose family sugar isomerase [Victivallaceae bacterium]|nr:D-lyxose/D-mannose family sugar isomerase [Victivallaceae bacterium]